MKIIRKRIKEAINPNDEGEGTLLPIRLTPPSTFMSDTDKDASKIMNRPPKPDVPDVLDSPIGKEYIQKMGIERKPITAPILPHRLSADDELRVDVDYIKRIKGIDEDAPANAAGAGNIAGLGVGAAGEPGISPRVQKKIQRKNRVEADTRSAVLGMWRRKTPQIAEGTEGVSVKSFVVEKGKFAGHDTFVVPSDMFHNARMQKKKGAHWTKYVGSGVHAEAIRQHAKANYGKPIILQDENTGAMCYASYGGKK
jgi:hypothetical protein